MAHAGGTSSEVPPGEDAATLSSGGVWLCLWPEATRIHRRILIRAQPVQIGGNVIYVRVSVKFALCNQHDD